jgi:hypothetical protein
MVPQIHPRQTKITCLKPHQVMCEVGTCPREAEFLFKSEITAATVHLRIAAYCKLHAEVRAAELDLRLPINPEMAMARTA